ncbi:envelope membrane protein [Gloeocapsa sp. PCC 7428]|uniref:proton extrusion protein PcxA n=1 Tax=Gloeocapsa sp. PCC 7428 TaxID=1173026 RepID=UPI0002A5D284|nr:proton extrusion protein PcxA [Gloeocapsa sp. PCC 7428]AFZ33005.1 envelope membrane protein [Gloeocapsa sp. PCC 7428]
MTSIPNNQGYLLANVKVHLHNMHRRFLNTPERALEQAYKAVLKIKELEQEYYSGEKIETTSRKHTPYVTSCLHANLDKNLNIAKLRLTEFKASSFVLGNLTSHHLSQVKIVDEVLTRYAPTDISSTLVDTTKTTIKNGSDRAYPSTVNVRTESVADKTGAVPRSIGRTINRIKKDFNPQAEAEVLQQFRTSRTKTLIAVKFLVILIAVPLVTQQVSKHLLISPIVEHFRVTQSQVFLNYEMKEEAMRELQSFEEGLRFNNLITTSPALAPEVIEQEVKEKATELAQEYHQKSNSAISNVFADLIAVTAFIFVLLISKKQIIALKSFMDEIVYGLSDSAKAFIIILFTDIFVGFHSPHGWEVILEGISSHLGIAANRSAIFLFIATFPVILDTIFKYWIFRYLSRISPSAVATLRNMNE